MTARNHVAFERWYVTTGTRYTCVICETESTSAKVFSSRWYFKSKHGIMLMFVFCKSIYVQCTMWNYRIQFSNIWIRNKNFTIFQNLLKMPKFDQKWKSKFLKGLFSVVVIARSSLTTSTTPLLPNDFHFNQCHHPALFGGHKVFVNATQLVGAIWYICSLSKFVTQNFQSFCGFINYKEAH